MKTRKAADHDPAFPIPLLVLVAGLTFACGRAPAESPLVATEPPPPASSASARRPLRSFETKTLGGDPYLSSTGRASGAPAPVRPRSPAWGPPPVYGEMNPSPPGPGTPVYGDMSPSPPGR